MAELLKELQIPVYYAPEHATTRFPPAETAALEHSDLGSEAWNIHVLNEQWHLAFYRQIHLKN